MAKANWLKVDPSQGSGNATVNVSSTAEHTGRKARTTTLTWKAANVANVVRNVSQAGKPEYVDISDAASADKLGKIVTISGVSNSAKLTFSFGTGDLLDITLPNTYTANSVATNNGAAISGDPGATAEYNFSISITVPANNDITGSFAPHGINGVNIAVALLSLSLRMVRQAITPGIAQPVPITIGMMDLPERPTRLKIGSITTETRAI